MPKAKAARAIEGKKRLIIGVLGMKDATSGYLRGGTDLLDADGFSLGRFLPTTVEGAHQQMVNQALPRAAMVNERLRWG